MQDIADVASQIGRPPRGEWSVVRRCACGKPQVIKTNPRLGDGTPFPTSWWLTCKTLCNRIGALEASGWMRTVNELLSSDENLHSQLVDTTRQYVTERDAIEVLGNDQHPGGGPDRVKCLHAHVAQHLVRGNNPIGSMALEELQWTDPEEACI